MKPLSEVIPNETQHEFERRVEEFYCYKFKTGERWVLFRDLLIVTHPQHEPIMVHEGGKIERLHYKLDFFPTICYNKG